MVNVLVDDKQAPVISQAEDITIYCDDAPYWADYPRCKGENCIHQRPGHCKSKTEQAIPKIRMAIGMDTMEAVIF